MAIWAKWIEITVTVTVRRLPLWVNVFVIACAIPSLAVAEPLVLHFPANNQAVTQSVQLQGVCRLGEPVEYLAKSSAGKQQGQFDCFSSPFTFDFHFEQLGENRLYIWQADAQGGHDLVRQRLQVVADGHAATVSPPDLMLASPVDRSQVSQTLVLRGDCEPGLPVQYYVASDQAVQTGQFACAQSPFLELLALDVTGPVYLYLKQVNALGNETRLRRWLSVQQASAQHQNRNSGGSLAINGLRISRQQCTSPCTVMFSLDRMTDRQADNAFTDNGVHWYYDDPDADERLGRIAHGADYFRNGRTENTGASRETDTNTPIGMHTYICEVGICVYRPGVAVQNAQGDWATEWATVVVGAEDSRYGADNTVCISSSGQFDGDSACPQGAEQRLSLPGPNEWQSDTRYLLRRGDQFAEACIGFDRQGMLLRDFGNASEQLPELNRVGLGHDGRCNDMIPTDAAAASYQTPSWLQDITLSNLRVGLVEVGMSFSDITLHGLDMDYGDATQGGWIRTRSTNACSNSANLSCANVPLPRGLYLSDTTIVGSSQQPPGLNVSLLSSTCISFFGVINSAIGTAFEHNIRMECASRVLVMHSDLNGNHIGDRGDKVALTVRPEGYLNQDMLEAGVRVNTNDGKAAMYDNRYLVAKGLYLGTPDSLNNSARVAFTATTRSVVEATRFGLVSDNITDLVGGSGSGPAHFDATFQGLGLVCYDDNDWTEGGAGCGDYAQGVLPDELYQPSRLNRPTPVVPMPPQFYSAVIE